MVFQVSASLVEDVEHVVKLDDPQDGLEDVAEGKANQCGLPWLKIEVRADLR
jgi:hypothetical protein